MCAVYVIVVIKAVGVGVKARSGLVGDIMVVDTTGSRWFISRCLHGGVVGLMKIRLNIRTLDTVSYTHLTLPTSSYV